MTTTIQTLSAAVEQSLSLKMLSIPTPYYIYGLTANYKRLPAGGGTTLRQRRYDPLQPSTVPLSKYGDTPPPTPVSAVNIDARVEFYGQYIQINERVTLQAQEPVLNELSIVLGRALRESEDELIRNYLKSAAASVNCTAGLNGDLPTEFTFRDSEEATEILLTQNAHTIMDSIMGENRFGTAPVRDAFPAIANTRLIPDFGTLAPSHFTHKANYPNDRGTISAEWGTVGNLRMMLTSVGIMEENASVNGNDVFYISIFGMGAFDIIEQDLASARFIYRDPMLVDPLAQNAQLGYKFTQVPKINQERHILNLKCTRSS